MRHSDGRGWDRLRNDRRQRLEFIRTDQLDLLGRNPAYQFTIPEDVYGEIEAPSQKQRLNQAIQRDYFHDVQRVQGEALRLYQDIRKRLDKGEAACIALSAVNDWYVASDETGALDEVAEAYLGRSKVHRSADILLSAVANDLVTVQRADKLKAQFEPRYSFNSFGDLL